jgi:hypothetical protein
MSNYHQDQDRQFIPGPFPRPPVPGFPFPPIYPPPAPGPMPTPDGQYQPMQPTTPPPNYIPQQQQAQPLQVAPGSLRMCLYRWTYVWLRNGQQYWIWPFRIRQQTVSFYRFVPPFRYVRGGLDTRQINSFFCV